MVSPIEITALLYKRLHDSAIESLKENPYLLCDPYYDVDFRGLADGSGDRARPVHAVRRPNGRRHRLYAHLQPRKNGHTFIPLDKLTTAVIRLLSDEDDRVR